MLDQSSRKDIESNQNHPVSLTGGMFKRKDNNSPTDSQATHTQIKDNNKIYPMTDTEVDDKVNSKWRQHGDETPGNYSDSDTCKSMPKHSRLKKNHTSLNPIAEADYIEELRGQTIISVPDKSLASHRNSVNSFVKPA